MQRSSATPWRCHATARLLCISDGSRFGRIDDATSQAAVTLSEAHAHAARPSLPVVVDVGVLVAEDRDHDRFPKPAHTVESGCAPLASVVEDDQPDTGVSPVTQIEARRPTPVHAQRRSFPDRRGVRSASRRAGGTAGDARSRAAARAVRLRATRRPLGLFDGCRSPDGLGRIPECGGHPAPPIDRRRANAARSCRRTRA
jgi:hypothetical protein